MLIYRDLTPSGLWKVTVESVYLTAQVLIIVGAADTPTCLVIEPSGVRFEDAQAEWGRSSSDGE